MFLVFILLLLSLWVWLFLSVYSAFFPFLQSVSHITDYNVAYYSALSAVERWSLVLKYSQPWFQWSGGILAGSGWWPVSDQWSFLASGDQKGNRRTISSRTTSIPASGEGNPDPLLLDSDSRDYNALRYHVLETFILSTDTTSDPVNYYSGANHTITQYAWGPVLWTLRLPPLVFSGFGGNTDAQLCANAAACDTDGDGITDEILVSRKMLWTYLGSAPFTILPSINVFYYSGMIVNYPYDNAIRASTIAPALGINFTSFSPIANGSSLSWHVVISSATGIQYDPFSTILGGISYTDLQISLGLIALLRSFWWLVYPYLEYRFDFAQAVSDRFYTIVGHGRNREYDVQIQIKKPTIQGTVGGDFTVIF